MIEPVLEYDEGKPYLICNHKGMEIVISFAEKEAEENVKSTILGIITDQYNQKAF